MPCVLLILYHLIQQICTILQTKKLTKWFKNFPKFIALTSGGDRIKIQVCVISKPNSNENCKNVVFQLYLKTAEMLLYFNIESFHLTPFNRSHPNQLTCSFQHFVPLGEYIFEVWETVYYQHLMTNSCSFISLCVYWPYSSSII